MVFQKKPKQEEEEQEEQISEEGEQRASDVIEVVEIPTQYGIGIYDPLTKKTYDMGNPADIAQIYTIILKELRKLNRKI